MLAPLPPPPPPPQPPLAPAPPQPPLAASVSAASFAEAALAGGREGESEAEGVERVAGFMELHFRALPPRQAEAHARYYAARVPLQSSPAPGAPPPPPLDGRALARYVVRWCTELLRGLRWSLSYYLDGVPSWDWCFPYRCCCSRPPPLHTSR